MEHISNVTGIDPISVRLANMAKDEPTIIFINDLRKNSEYDNRLKEIQEFNEVMTKTIIINLLFHVFNFN